MDVKGALEAIEAIRSTVPTSEQASLDAELATRLGLVSETVGAVAVEAAREALDPLEVKESIHDQLNSAFVGFHDVVDVLNQDRKKKELLTVTTPETLQNELETWLTDNKVDYIKAAMEADPDLRFTLVATPNIVANKDQIIALAKAFGKSQPIETYVWEEIYGKYSAEQLSSPGARTGASVILSLIPNKVDEKLYGTAEHQRAKLAEMQAEHPSLKVTSVLEDITYWYTLRSAGHKLVGPGTDQLTYIRHFDLPERRIDDLLYVPYSFVFDDGKPGLNRSYAGDDSDARVSVG